MGILTGKDKWCPYLSQAVKLQDFVKGSGLLLEKQFFSATSESSSCLRHLNMRVWIPKEWKGKCS